MKTDQLTKVKPVTEERILLDASLRPLWVYMRYNQIFPDFSSRGKANRVFYITRFLFTLLVVSIVLIFTAFMLYRLVGTAKIGDKKGFAIIFFFAIIGLYSIAFQYQCLIHRHEFQQFFKDWKLVEMQTLEYFLCAKEKNVVKVFYVVYLTLLWIIVISIFFWNYMQPSAPFFLSSIPYLRDKLHISVIYLITAVCQYFIHIYFLMGEVIPPLFFFHAGCVIEDLEREMKHISEVYYSKGLNLMQPAFSIAGASAATNPKAQVKNVTHFRRVWEKYEITVHWVNRANELFGTLILFGYSGMFILCSVSSYLAIENVFKDPAIAALFTGIFMLNTLRIILINRLMSNLIFSCEELKSTVAFILSEKWHMLSEEEHLLLVSFKTRLAKEEMAASPFALYSVNPGNLLSMLSLVVTYAITLVQFQS